MTDRGELEQALHMLGATALARICGILGLTRGGRKVDRVSRLLDSTYPEATVLDLARKALFAKEVAHLASSWSYKAELKEQGLPVSGSKEEKIWRLIENNVFDPATALGHIRLDKLRELYQAIHGRASTLSREGTSAAILRDYGLGEYVSDDLEANSIAGSSGGVTRVFVSHSHNDYRSVKDIKGWLERFGTAVFVAHKDIRPTTDWREEILANLKNCDLFLAFLTEAYRDSEWTDQEFGIARALGKRVLPVVLDGKGKTMPYGFMDEYQAFRWEARNPQKSLRELVRTVLDELSVPTEEIVRGFERSRSFGELGFGLWLILERSDLEVEQINRIARAFLNNPEARNSPLGNSGMDRFYRAYEHEMDPELRDRLGRMPVWGPRSRMTP